MIEFDAPGPQGHPVMRCAGDHDGLGVTGEDDAQDAQLACLGQHVGGQRVGDPERAFRHGVAGGRGDDDGVVDAGIQLAHRDGAGALVAEDLEVGAQGIERVAVLGQDLFCRGGQKEVHIGQASGQRQGLDQAMARAGDGPGDAAASEGEGQGAFMAWSGACNLQNGVCSRLQVHKPCQPGRPLSWIGGHLATTRSTP